MLSISRSLKGNYKWPIKCLLHEGEKVALLMFYVDDVYLIGNPIKKFNELS
jgi:hypothetical protein